MGAEETGLIQVLSFRDIQEDRSSVKKKKKSRLQIGYWGRSQESRHEGIWRNLRMLLEMKMTFDSGG